MQLFPPSPPSFPRFLSSSTFSAPSCAHGEQRRRQQRFSDALSEMSIPVPQAVRTNSPDPSLFRTCAISLFNFSAVPCFLCFYYYYFIFVALLSYLDFTAFFSPHTDSAFGSDAHIWHILAGDLLRRRELSARVIVFHLHLWACFSPCFSGVVQNVLW